MALSPIPFDGPDAIRGDLRVHRGFPARALGRPIDLTVWLPPGHDASGAHYPVLYFHDGGNLWAPSDAWNGSVWGLDTALADLAAAGRPVIAVGMACHPTERMNEYSPYLAPWPEYAHLAARGLRGPDHLAFLVDELKPQVDALFHTLPGRDDTGVCGSSAGGTMSVYSWARRPDVFGMVGAFSPALQLCGDELWADVRAALEGGARARFHVSVGGRESDDPTSRLGYVSWTRALVDALDDVGLPVRQVYDSEATHHETAWAAALPDALRFLLGEGQGAVPTP